MHPVLQRSVAEEIQNLRVELRGGKARGIEHKVCMVPDRLQQRSLFLQSLGHAHTAPCQRVGTAGLLITVDNGLIIRLQKEHTAVDARGLHLLQGIYKFLSRLPGTHIIHQRYPVISALGCRAKLRKHHHHLSRKIIHDIVADVL